MVVMDTSVQPKTWLLLDRWGHLSSLEFKWLMVNPDLREICLLLLGDTVIVVMNNNGKSMGLALGGGGSEVGGSSSGTVGL